RHRIALPQTLARLHAEDAYFEEESLRVTFRRGAA
ncbi:MAG: hypothetical protein HGA65_16060, partial [Oscillochloris sp.]|nr:hypothetical protein [Oscillochloris sp.]